MVNKHESSIDFSDADELAIFRDRDVLLLTEQDQAGGIVHNMAEYFGLDVPRPRQSDSGNG